MYECAMCGRYVEDAAKCLMDKYLCSDCCVAIDKLLHDEKESIPYVQNCREHTADRETAAFLSELLLEKEE